MFNSIFADGNNSQRKIEIMNEFMNKAKDSVKCGGSLVVDSEQVNDISKTLFRLLSDHEESSQPTIICLRLIDLLLLSMQGIEGLNSFQAVLVSNWEQCDFNDCKLFANALTLLWSSKIGKVILQHSMGRTLDVMKLRLQQIRTSDDATAIIKDDLALDIARLLKGVTLVVQTKPPQQELTALEVSAICDELSYWMRIGPYDLREASSDLIFVLKSLNSASLKSHICDVLIYYQGIDPRYTEQSLLLEMVTMLHSSLKIFDGDVLTSTIQIPANSECLVILCLYQQLDSIAMNSTEVRLQQVVFHAHARWFASLKRTFARCAEIGGNAFEYEITSCIHKSFKHILDNWDGKVQLIRSKV